MERKMLLQGRYSHLSVVSDKKTDTYSIAISDGYKPNVKMISKELYEMIVEELEGREYVQTKIDRE